MFSLCSQASLFKDSSHLYQLPMNSFSISSVFLGADVIGVTDCDTFYPFFGSYNMIRWLSRTLYMFPHSSVVQNTGCVTAYVTFPVLLTSCTVYRLGVISHSHIINSTHQLLHSKEGMCNYIFQYFHWYFQLLYISVGTYITVTVTVNVSNDLVQYIIVKPRHHR